MDNDNDNIMGYVRDLAGVVLALTIALILVTMLGGPLIALAIIAVGLGGIQF